MIWLLNPLTFKIDRGVKTKEELDKVLALKMPYTVLQERTYPGNISRDKVLNGSIAHIEFDGFLVSLMVRIRRYPVFNSEHTLTEHEDGPFFAAYFWTKRGESWCYLGLRKNADWLKIWITVIEVLNGITDNKLLSHSTGHIITDIKHLILSNTIKLNDY